MMMKRALAIALIGAGIGAASHEPVRAAAVSIAGIGAPLTDAGRGILMPAGNACWWDVPVLGAGVAFLELLRDEEFDYSCSDDHYVQEYHPGVEEHSSSCKGSECPWRPVRRGKQAPAE